MGSHFKMNSPSQGKRRPISFLLLVFALLLMSIYGWLRFQQSLILWNTLIEIEVWPGPLYLAISGAAWGMIGIITAIGLFLRQAWAWRLTRFAVFVIAIWYWFDRLVLVQSEAAQSNWAFMALLTLLAFGYTFSVLKRCESIRVERNRS
jgi:hypothetical protein